ncbi:PPR repeat family [Rhizoctonia solani]|uniref:PPR repeat family n=1 Tax=Rhizoctonia solani TaxID=456999 RepID=A0A8H7M5J7_9AGAM|nr:PPR repeat family [Rhizoctonia solani]
MAYYEEMKKKIPQAEITIRSYNVVIHGLFTGGRPDAALKLVADLEAGSALPTPTHPVPDITTYNTMLRYYSRRREMGPLSKVLHNIADRQLRPDAYTLTTVLNALLAVGVQDAPSKILGIMKALRVQVNEAIVSELIEDVVYRVPGRGPKKNNQFFESTRAWTRSPPNPSNDQDAESSPRDRLQTGVKMLVAFENAGVPTNVVNYTSLMAAFHRAAGAGTGPQYISHSEAQKATQALRSRMKKRRIRENRITYNILIAACLEGGDVPKSKWRELAPTPTAGADRPAVDLTVYRRMSNKRCNISMRCVVLELYRIMILGISCYKA